jgi:hypothetical protein
LKQLNGIRQLYLGIYQATHEIRTTWPKNWPADWMPPHAEMYLPSKTEVLAGLNCLMNPLLAIIPPLRLISMGARCQHFMSAPFAEGCPTVAIKSRAECGSHGNESHTLEGQRTLPNADLVRLGSHQRHLAFRSRHLLLCGRGPLDQFDIALPLLLCHCDEKQLISLGLRFVGPNDGSRGRADNSLQLGSVSAIYVFAVIYCLASLRRRGEITASQLVVYL